MTTVLLRRVLIALTITATVATAGCQAGSDDAAPAVADRPSTDAPSGANGSEPPRTLPTSVLPVDQQVVLGPPATDAVTAVRTFVQAEAAGDATTSWSMLSAEDRRRYPSPGIWRMEHRQLPQLKAGTVTGTATPLDNPARAGLTDADQAVSVPGSVQFDAALDLDRGLVPATATAEWLVVAEDGGWRVAYEHSTFNARFPADTGAVSAASAWASARQQCRSTAADGGRLEVVGGVVGVAGLAQRLCGQKGAIRVGTVQRLDTTDAASVIAAFGAGAAEWARTVELEGPVPQRVVLGPLGDHWIAIGVLAA